MLLIGSRRVVENSDGGWELGRRRLAAGQALCKSSCPSPSQSLVVLDLEQVRIFSALLSISAFFFQDGGGGAS